MNKRLIASVSCAALLLSSTGIAVQANSAKKLVAVDAVAAATTTAPAPTTPAKPSTSAKPSTATTKTTATSSKISRLLALGSVGGDVTLLQTLLNSNGYVLKTDGIFGERTLAAVKGYQGKNGLRIDGIVGPKTLAKLAPVVAETVEPAKPVEPTKPVEPAKPAETTEPTKPVEEKVEEKVDAVTTASIVNDAAAFEKAISADGTWIIATLNDLTFDKELVLEGKFTSNKKDAEGNPVVDRKIAPYTQDDNKVVLERFTITAPKLTIKSPNARLQAGIFKIDNIYVESPGFKLRDAKVEGNIYFTTQEAKDSFVIDEKSSVTGEIALMDVDATSTASIVKDEAAFEKAIVKKEDGGTWIAALLKDLRFNKELTLEGEFTNKDKLDRKIGLYSQDDQRNQTHRFTLTVPKLFIESPNARMYKGIFNGNLYVSSDNFTLVDTLINGNVYFTNESAKSTFKPDEKTVINGEQELVDVDAIASASVVTDEVNFEKAISKHGKWIICLEDNITTDKELVLEGDFLNKRYAVQRKIALYTQDDKKNVTAKFTLTAPKLTIKSPNASIQKGTFKGDLYVTVPNFKLVDTKVEGNIYFTTQEAKDSFIMDDTSSVTGVQELK